MLSQALAAAISISLTIAMGAYAQDVPPPEGDVILTISGEIDTVNVDGTLQFDREAFVALGMRTVETNTIWTDGIQTFEGVPLSTLTDLMGMSEGSLLATAINDYTIEIPLSDAVQDGPIVAVLLNGEEMSIRDKGPLWVIYPYDESADYRTEVVYSRSIWQLDRIEVVR